MVPQRPHPLLPKDTDLPQRTRPLARAYNREYMIVATQPSSMASRQRYMLLTQDTPPRVNTTLLERILQLTSAQAVLLSNRPELFQGQGKSNIQGPTSRQIPEAIPPILGSRLPLQFNMPKDLDNRHPKPTTVVVRTIKRHSPNLSCE